MTLPRSGNKVILLALINVMESSVRMGQEAGRKRCTSLQRVFVPVVLLLSPASSQHHIPTAWLLFLPVCALPPAA